MEIKRWARRAVAQEDSDVSARSSRAAPPPLHLIPLPSVALVPLGCPKRAFICWLSPLFAFFRLPRGCGVPKGHIKLSQKPLQNTKSGDSQSLCKALRFFRIPCGAALVYDRYLIFLKQECLRRQFH